MFLLWARFQGTAVGSIKTFLRQEISNRANEISDQITNNLTAQKTRIQTLIQQPLLKQYAHNIANNQQAAPDDNLKVELSAFLLGNQQYYSALLCNNLEGVPLFKLEPGTDTSTVIRPYEAKAFAPGDSLSPKEIPANGDSLIVSEIEQDGVTGPYIKIIAPLLDDANHVNGAFVVRVRADEMLKEAAGPRADSLAG
ncbi:MAG: cache domain-containing protein, partial [Blastocatellia bacterium]|nr:cache domain-containing protein [Blastocatellia bacterium]